jgi:hypothetical protein
MKRIHAGKLRRRLDSVEIYGFSFNWLSDFPKAQGVGTDRIQICCQICFYAFIELNSMQDRQDSRSLFKIFATFCLLMGKLLTCALL